ncbi:homeobox protein Hox-C4 [Trifolium medium]|uniref:Homeobox protein Hox-C4 n=1 Tax=Trifolium medium TaxID=97028 RepID=A0A392QER5_9FABA|nr:homeobox protein Hox-C4 [Trifolium medium]
MSTMSGSAAHTSMDLESVPVLPWVPRTTSAVCLRLFEFDTSIAYVKLEKPEPCEEKEARYISSNSLCFLAEASFKICLCQIY